MLRPKGFFVAIVISVGSAIAQINETGSLKEIEFSQLGERDPNPLGEKALAIHPEQWKHSETDHFIYSVNYDLKVLKIRAGRHTDTADYVVNPAFWPALGIKPVRDNLPTH